MTRKKNDKLLSWNNNKGIQQEGIRKGKDGKYRKKLERWKTEQKCHIHKIEDPKRGHDGFLK